MKPRAAIDGRLVDLRPLVDELRNFAAGRGGGGPDYRIIVAADGAKAEAAFRRAKEMLSAT